MFDGNSEGVGFPEISFAHTQPYMLRHRIFPSTFRLHPEVGNRRGEGGGVSGYELRTRFLARTQPPPTPPTSLPCDRGNPTFALDPTPTVILVPHNLHYPPTPHIFLEPPNPELLSLLEEPLPVQEEPILPVV